MHLPHSPVIKSSPLHHLSRSTKSTTSFLYNEKSFKNTASHFSTFLPFSASKIPQKQIYSFSEMNLKDVHIKKIKPTKVQRPKIKTPSVTPMAKWSTSPKSRKLPVSIY